ncbi:peroxiredoxin [Pleomorphomonas diazotrophica]|uniref:Glutathione-dependent peroxiredoxin n=1 Tax=Pleomorphomonas diazotrophica TaxID=1166257 RepID=A0A1I4TSX9_9HYPH|nr:peroxiredoxin [Pleomorphomonas diazotrophica]PKR87658.1 peroxiredoxin [Pleomorphomonas diazotrophica]SFM79828.1 Peroxiredoxin [Pleomorphomonas diazotrophica]
MIKVGDKLPAFTFLTPTADGGRTEITTDDVFAGKKVVLVAVPGAFTPTCSKNHVPGFIQKFDEIRAKGIDTVAVVAVNDAYVLGAWRNTLGAGDKILFLGDGSAAFAKEIGLSQDFGASMGVRSRRYAAIVEDGVVKDLQVEEKASETTCSAAPSIVERL